MCIRDSAYSTIKYIHNLLYPALEMAVDDNIIRKNPAKSSISDYGKPAEEKEALTVSQQEKFMEFVKQSNVYNLSLIHIYGAGRSFGSTSCIY